MTAAIGSTTTTGSSSQSQIVLLEKQLAKYAKQLSADQTSGNAKAAQLVATQMALVESEIAQLSKTAETPVASVSSDAARTGALGTHIDTMA